MSNHRITTKEDGIMAGTSGRDRDTRTAVPEGQDSRDTGSSLSRDVSAFLAVTEDRVPEARRIVKDMSGRDRAVLSFWLQELSRIVEDAELSRRI